MSTRQLLNDERAELITLLRDLSEDEWEAPSLCAGWRVRDVVGHLLYDEMSLLGYARFALGYRLNTDRVNNGLVDRARDLTTAQLIERFENSGQRITGTWPSLGLADILVHQQDIRRPLGRPRTIPADRLVAVLRHPDPFAGPRRYTRGLRFVATDVEWSAGTGPEVRGPGEALALAAVGRPAALEDLTGEGMETLRRRHGV
ncbi:maleylpyruvate isomerase family mycothiol-dependent enzyme [Nocardia violaceofusca]|uniref:maleylpyruvate isomerase family mycothiol-dependent enzyme n=1 Tax=Nocardia violaceofusca TaxID=941182 RepID=UPI0007A42F40|nr:maleylpyruvate isomerase family mycothiol-dependent enzyme [Nocardia violaceofusca]